MGGVGGEEGKGKGADTRTHGSFLCARHAPARTPSRTPRPDSNDDGLIDFPEFIEIDRRFPLVLFPAFRLQSAMQKQTLGESGWKHINEAVVRQQRINDYMELHGGKEPPEGYYTKFMKTLGLMNKKKVHVDRIIAARPAAAAKLGD